MKIGERIGDALAILCCVGIVTGLMVMWHMVGLHHVLIVH